MRDRQRIKRIMRKLQWIWEEQPDMRFNQLMVDLMFDTSQDMDVFYTEDDQFENILNQKIDQLANLKNPYHEHTAIGYHTMFDDTKGN